MTENLRQEQTDSLSTYQQALNDSCITELVEKLSDCFNRVTKSDKITF
ncbi:hypothetical protein NDI44_24510 [Trichocoleus sp. DQ-A3]|jgi:hypothetical protein|nr:hypothetical protein [Coleofasciculus sp. FACHB-125]MBD1902087.1 hypothetical protein [Coleofasciculus sp. FACHB-125]